MSYQHQNSQLIRDAIVWFNNLRPEEQSLLIAKLGDTEYYFTPEQTNNLTIIALDVTNALSTTSREQIVSNLGHAGMDKVFATLIVDKIMTQPALAQLDARRLSSLDDTQFSKAIETVVFKAFVENNNIEQLLTDSGLKPEEFEAVFRFIRDSALFTYVRGEISKENLRSLLMDKAKFSDNRATMLIDLLETHRATLMNNFMFRATQDTLLRVQRMENVQAEILSQFKELVLYIRQKFGEGKQEGQPPLYG